MNRDRIEGVWKQIRGRLKQRWGVLTSSRLSAIAGVQSQLAGRIQERCGIAREESQLKRFLHRNRQWNPGNDHGGARRLP
jgi:uncharacterized protein YjbJ (UPF0337 family)